MNALRRLAAPAAPSRLVRAAGLALLLAGLGACAADTVAGPADRLVPPASPSADLAFTGRPFSLTLTVWSSPYGSVASGTAEVNVNPGTQQFCLHVTTVGSASASYRVRYAALFLGPWPSGASTTGLLPFGYTGNVAGAGPTTVNACATVPAETLRAILRSPADYSLWIVGDDLASGEGPFLLASPLAPAR